MFKIKPNPTFEADITVPLPGGGDETLRLVFAHKSRSAMQDLGSRLEGMSSLDVMCEIVVGWVGVDAEFSREALCGVLDEYHSLEEAIWVKYRSELSQARKGN